MSKIVTERETSSSSEINLHHATHEGRIAEVDLEEGKVNRYIDLGGFPTRIVLLAKESLMQ